MPKEAYYFSHDSNARNDIKIIRLRRALGLEGYAIYFCLIEILREQKDHKLPLASVTDIAFDLRTSDEKLKAVISGYDLFIIEEEKFFSSRLLRSMEDYTEKKKKLSDAGKKGNSLRWNGQLQLPELSTSSGSDNNPIALKEIKEKEIYNMFILFWELYNNKVGRSEAEKAWKKLSFKEATECIEKTPKWIEHLSKDQWRKKPYPSTYINQKRWQDEIIQNVAQPIKETLFHLP